jgi:hypothetical protein
VDLELLMVKEWERREMGHKRESEGGGMTDTRALFVKGGD